MSAGGDSLSRVKALLATLSDLLRFEVEAGLLGGDLAVADVPEAWNARVEESLGIAPEDDAEGALQDIHWASGAFGYFPTYTIGNLLAAQLWEAALAALPEIPDEIERGEFGALRAWLAENVWRHGQKHDPDDLMTRATGRPVEPGPYLRYLRHKFGELYGLP